MSDAGVSAVTVDLVIARAAATTMWQIAWEGIEIAPKPSAQSQARETELAGTCLASRASPCERDCLRGLHWRAKCGNP
jgi:hypothetical protein